MERPLAHTQRQTCTLQRFGIAEVAFHGSAAVDLDGPPSLPTDATLSRSAQRHTPTRHQPSGLFGDLGVLSLPVALTTRACGARSSPRHPTWRGSGEVVVRLLAEGGLRRVGKKLDELAGVAWLHLDRGCDLRLEGGAGGEGRGLEQREEWRGGRRRGLLAPR